MPLMPAAGILPSGAQVRLSGMTESRYFTIVDFYCVSESASMSHIYDMDYAANIPVFPAPLLDLTKCGVRHYRQSRRLEGFEPLKAVGGVTPVLNDDLRRQKPTLAEQIGSSAFISVSQRFKIRNCQTL
jgi:hypothetical protein